MPKRLKRYIANCLLMALAAGLCLFLYETVGPLVAGEHYHLGWWGIVLVFLAVLAGLVWRLWVGIESGRLLVDELDD